MKNQWFESNLSKITRPVAAIKSLRFALFWINAVMRNPRGTIKYYRSADILRRPIESRRGKILSSRGEIANRHEYTSLQWRHNEHNGVSNHQPDDCLLNRLFRLTSKKPQTPASLALYVGNSPVTGEFATQMASNEENVSIWWRHHVHRVTWGKTPIGLNQGWF